MGSRGGGGFFASIPSTYEVTRAFARLAGVREMAWKLFGTQPNFPTASHLVSWDVIKLTDMKLRCNPKIHQLRGCSSSCSATQLVVKESFSSCSSSSSFSKVHTFTLTLRPISTPTPLDRAPPPSYFDRETPPVPRPQIMTCVLEHTSL